MPVAQRNRLDRAVDEQRDHILGDSGAAITLVEFGSYACPYCRAATEHIAAVRARFGTKLRYVYRHQPLVGSRLARPAAELAERAASADEFWSAHNTLMTRSSGLSEDDLATVAHALRLEDEAPAAAADAAARARQRVDEDEAGALASGALITPTFFINGRRYDGPWDDGSLAEAMQGTLSHRVQAAALDFASWAPSAGLLLSLAALIALALSNSALNAPFAGLWRQPFGVALGTVLFSMPVIEWINDGLLTLFFLVVGLEVKREFTVGCLANRSAAALPIASAIGGMLTPAILYTLVIPSGVWSNGWGVPMATDTAFAVALLASLGARVPIDLRVFLTAAAIVDDIGSIAVVGVFYSGAVQVHWLIGAIVVCAGLAVLNYARVYNFLPYLFLGTVLWACVHASGLHATMSGVIVALFVPTRSVPNLQALIVQASSIMAAEDRRTESRSRISPSPHAIRALSAIHERLESPADRVLRHAAAPVSFLILPLFALANAGVTITPTVFTGHVRLIAAIMTALAIGKPLGFVLGGRMAVALGWATKPASYNWRQLTGAGAIAGVGFTMSLFITAVAYHSEADFTAAKLAVLAGSAVAALAGCLILMLWRAPREPNSKPGLRSRRAPECEVSGSHPPSACLRRRRPSRLSVPVIP